MHESTYIGTTEENEFGAFGETINDCDSMERIIFTLSSNIYETKSALDGIHSHLLLILNKDRTNKNSSLHSNRHPGEWNAQVNETDIARLPSMRMVRNCKCNRSPRFSIERTSPNIQPPLDLLSAFLLNTHATNLIVPANKPVCTVQSLKYLPRNF